MSPPVVTAIILNWCKEIVTAECIRSVLSSDYGALKVLLVDNGSLDDSFDRLQASFPDIEFLQTGKNLGYAGGNNRGIEQVLQGTTDYILILNNDTVLERCAVRKLVDTAEMRAGKVG